MSRKPETPVVVGDGAPVLARAVAAGALAKAGDLDGAQREVGKVAASGGWQSEGSDLRSVSVGHLAGASVPLGEPWCRVRYGSRRNDGSAGARFLSAET